MIDVSAYCELNQGITINYYDDGKYTMMIKVPWNALALAGER